MYDFHYNFIKKNFNPELLFTDTDSLTYEIKSEDVYKEFYKWKFCSILVIILKIRHSMMIIIKKVIEKMKGEYVGVIVDEFIGLKAKMY